MASLTPVIVTAWLDPPLQTDFQVGSSVTWHATFLDRMTRTPVDPDIVNFIYSVPPAERAKVNELNTFVESGGASI